LAALPAKLLLLILLLLLKFPPLLLTIQRIQVARATLLSLRSFGRRDDTAYRPPAPTSATATRTANLA
jgi:hypothetical protein